MPHPSLEVRVPFLDGTYDERVFEELRMRAQTFEVLTGATSPSMMCPARTINHPLKATNKARTSVPWRLK
jgi:hypothetical protein